MFRCNNLWSLCVNFPIANPDLIDSVHQLRDKIKIEAGAAEGRDLLLGSNNYMRIFNGVIEIVPRHDETNLNQVPGDVFQKQNSITQRQNQRRNPNDE